MAGWTVLVFGDSWADYAHPTWPQVLGRRLSAQTLNFAQAGSLASDLVRQGQRSLMDPRVPKAAAGLLKAETLVVIHTCGNDLIQKMVEVFMGGGMLGSLLGGGAPPPQAGPAPEVLLPNPGAREAASLSGFLETMHRAGARHFLVSSVPCFLQMPIFNMLWPVIQGLVNQGKLEAIGMSPGDPPQLAMEVQGAALHERWVDLVEKFSKEHPESCCVFFDEVAALERLRSARGAATFDRTMWDFTMFHPSPFGHEEIASEAHRCALDGIPALAAGGAQATRAPTPSPAAPPAAPAAPAAAASPVVGAQPITVQAKNVKGDVSFTVAADGGWSADRLHQAVVAAAPAGLVPGGKTLVFTHKGKLLPDGAPTALRERGFADNAQIFFLLRSKPAS